MHRNSTTIRFGLLIIGGRQYVIFIGTDDRGGVVVKGVQMGSAAKRTGRKRWHDIPSVQIGRGVGLIQVHDDATSMPGAVLPIVIQRFISMDKDDAIIDRTASRHTTASTVGCTVSGFAVRRCFAGQIERCQQD